MRRHRAWFTSISALCAMVLQAACASGGKPETASVATPGVASVSVAGTSVAPAGVAQSRPIGYTMIASGACESGSGVWRGEGIVCLSPSNLARVKALRYGAECGEILARAALDSAAYKHTAATPLTMFMPPLPFPLDVRGKAGTVTAVIDAGGNIVSVSAFDLHNVGYQRKLLATLKKMAALPATVDGCAKSGNLFMTLTFD